MTSAGITEEMRTKEDAHDYRYFPDPDLMPLAPADDWLAAVRQRVVELPLARKQRFMRDYQLPAGDAEVFKNDVALGNYFEPLARQSKHPKAAANWIINNLRAKLTETIEREQNEQAALGLEPAEMKLTSLADLKFKPEALLELVALVEAKTISSSAAQQVFARDVRHGQGPGRDCPREGAGPGQRHRRD